MQIIYIAIQVKYLTKGYNGSAPAGIQTWNLRSQLPNNYTELSRNLACNTPVTCFCTNVLLHCPQQMSQIISAIHYGLVAWPHPGLEQLNSPAPSQYVEVKSFIFIPIASENIEILHCVQVTALLLELPVRDRQ